MTKGQKIALGILVGIPLTCLLGGMAIMQGTFGSAAASRDRELAKARSEGLPTTPADLARMAAAPDDQNAGPVYKKLLALTGADVPKGPLGKEFDAVAVGSGLIAKPEQRQAAIAALPKLQPVLALAREAAAYPHCDFRRDWAAGVKLEFPEYSPMKSAARALCFEAMQRSEEGDWRGALADLAVAQKLAQHAMEDPNLIGLLVSVSIEGITHVAFRRIIDAHSHDRAFVAEARKVLAGYGPIGNFRRAIMGEMGLGRTVLNQVRSFRDLDLYNGNTGDEHREPSPFERGLFSSGIVRNAFDARLMRSYRLFIEDIPADPNEWQRADVAARGADLRAREDTSIASLPSSIVMPVFTNAAEALGRELAHRRLLDITLRLLQARRNGGAFPPTLPDYGAGAIDPFSHQPFVYRREGNGFILYSFGVDRVDHGGATTANGNGGEGYNEVIRIH